MRHSLIIFALQYYGFPEHFIQLVRSYYDHLSVVVAVPGILSTSAIHFALGVFQGCTFFNIIVQVALDSIEMKHCGYQFSSDPETVLQSSAYADDTRRSGACSDTQNVLPPETFCASAVCVTHCV